MMQIELKDIAAAVQALKTTAEEKFGSHEEKQAELQARLLGLEQVMAKYTRGAGGGEGDPSVNLLECFQRAGDLKHAARGVGDRVYIDLPKSYFAKSTLTNADALGRADVLPGIMGLNLRRLTIRDLLPTVQTTASSISYVRESGFTNNAATVAEGGAKPESDVTLDLESQNIVTIAHWLKASTQILSDFPALQVFIDVRLRYGLRLKEEDQLLLGSGVGNNLTGLKTAATSFSTTVSGDTQVDILRRAKAALEVAGYVPNGYIVHPNDWAAIELAKDADGNYICGQPRGANPATIWNTPAVITPAMPEGEYLVGDYQQAAMIFDRWEPRVMVATQNEDDFTHNLVTVLAEERLALVIHRADAMRKGTY